MTNQITSFKGAVEQAEKQAQRWKAPQYVTSFGQGVYYVRGSKIEDSESLTKGYTVAAVHPSGVVTYPSR